MPIDRSDQRRITLPLVLFVLMVLSHMLFAQVSLNLLGRYQTGVFDESAAEIVAHDPATQRLYVVNGDNGGIDVLDIANPANPSLLFTIDLSPYGAGANSVAAAYGHIVAAVENDDKQAPGKLVVFDADGNYLLDWPAGALPDMVTVSPDGRYVIAANEGEPDDDYVVDPEGSVTIVDLHTREVSQLDFRRFNGREDDLLLEGVRVFGPNATVAQDFEPEYIAVDPRSRKAYVTLQENNAIAVVDLRRARITDVFGLGVKDHGLPGNALDASNRDNGINIRNWPVLGMYQPDAIAAYKARDGKTYLVTANEGDARDYDGYSEEARIKDLTLDPDAFPDAATLQRDENLGRLTTSTAYGDFDGDGDVEYLFSLGARSFSIWKTDGEQVFDSGSELEEITAALLPDAFNSTNDENGSFDNRSDDKGPEPEGLVIAELDGRTYLFLGLERVGGVMVYDISDAHAPVFVEYVNSRDFSGDAEQGTAGDLGPEGLIVIPADESPTGAPLLVVAYEVSGSTAIYEINSAAPVSDRDGQPDAAIAVADRFALAQNYPNPFNPETAIRFSLETAGAASLVIFNNLGQEVRTLVNGSLTAGAHEVRWNGRDNAGNPAVSGVYYYRLTTGDQVAVKRMTLMR